MALERSCSLICLQLCLQKTLRFLSILNIFINLNNFRYGEKIGFFRPFPIQYRYKDKLREKKRELEQKEYDERTRFREKFVQLLKAKGKRVAFYFVDQFYDFRNC